MPTKEEVNKELALRELGRRRLEFFMKYTHIADANSKVYQEYWHTRIMCEALNKVLSGDIKRLILELPPRHFKSQHASRYLPALYLGQVPNGKVIAATSTETFAAKLGGDVREIMQSEKYADLFPTVKVRSDYSAKADWKTNEGGSYIARGIGGQTTGEGANLLIIDDAVKNQEEANSAVVRESTFDWYSTVANTRLAPDGRQILIGTRWHEDDLIGRVLEIEGDRKFGGKWTRIKFPAIAEEDEEFRKKGEALLPEWYPIEVLEEKKKLMGIPQFSALYQQDPIGAMGALFKKQDFQYFAMSDFELQGTNLVKSDIEVAIICDPAFSSRKGSDDTVVMALGRHKRTHDIYLLDSFADTVPPSVGKTIPVNMALRWKGQGWNVIFVSVEDVSINPDQQLFVRAVDEEMRSQRLMVSLRRFHPKQKKEDRIRYQVEPYISRHSFYFCTEDPLLPKIEEQFIRFQPIIGANSKDDILDCVAQGIEQFGGLPEDEPQEKGKEFSQMWQASHMKFGV